MATKQGADLVSKDFIETTTTTLIYFTQMYKIVLKLQLS